MNAEINLFNKKNCKIYTEPKKDTFENHYQINKEKVKQSEIKIN